MAKYAQENFIVSPLSVQTVMALLTLGSSGDTYEELYRGLSLPKNSEDIRKMFHANKEFIKGNKYYALNAANRLYAGNSFELKQDFRQAAVQDFNADIVNIDFNQNYNAAAAINQWVEAKTNYKIHDLVQPNDLGSDTALLVVNALHFKGKWLTPFDVFDTKEEQFYNPKGNQSVEMMFLNEYFDYYENTELDCKFIELPYMGDDISMVIALPNEYNGLPKLEQRIDEVMRPQPFTKTHVKIAIPKMSIESTINYNDILMKMGIKKVFGPEGNLHNIGTTPSANPLYVNKVIQKTFMNITEKGTEAASATASSVITLSLPAQYAQAKISFIADHPFIYYIKIKNRRQSPNAQTILFMGRFRGLY